MKKNLLFVFIFFIQLFVMYGKTEQEIINLIEESDSFVSFAQELTFNNVVEIDDIYFVTYDYLFFEDSQLLTKRIYYSGNNDIDYFIAYQIPNYDENSNFYRQSKYLYNTGTTSLIGDFDFDENLEYFYFGIFDFNCEMNIKELDDDNGFLINNNFCSHTDFLYKEGLLNIMDSYYKQGFDFCIINGKRGIRIKKYIGKQNNYKTEEIFFCWVSSEHLFVLDESVTQEQLENAYCPEDYFAYNGLKFSKLDSKLTAEDLKDLDKAQLRLMRNAVYARHGRTFKSVDLQSLWNCYTWYKSNYEYSNELLTEVDKYNIELIRKYESN